MDPVANKFVYAGTLICPVKWVQLNIAEKTLKALPKIDDDKARATLAYSIINLLHMFSDGNGRTSRLVFEILNNPEFNIEETSEQYIHKEGQSRGIRNIESKHGIISNQNTLEHINALTQNTVYFPNINPPKPVLLFFPVNEP